MEGDDVGSVRSLMEAERLYAKHVPEYRHGTPISPQQFEKIIAMPHR